MISIPTLGLGTFGRTGDEGREAIRLALELGYRHLDSAQTYGSEPFIAAALADSGIPRTDVCLTTKVADTHLRRRDLLESVRQSLDRLRVDQIDLLLIHWPSHRDAVPFEEYIDALAEAKALGMTRLIGVSNFTSALVSRAVARLGAGEVAVNQVECHPFLQNRILRATCARHEVVVTAYMPLAVGRIVGDPVLEGIGRRLGETAATVTLAWLFQQGMLAIPSSTKRDHLVANLRALRVALSTDDAAAIERLDRGERIVNPTKSPEWD